jgi:predicted RND superfamily exporter protein
LGTSIVGRLLRFAFLRRRAVLSLALATALVTIPFVARVRFDANVLNLMPRRGPAVNAFRTFLERFGSLDHLYIVFDAPEGHDIAEYSPVVDAYIDALRRTPEIGRVDAALFQADRDWSYLAERELVLLGPEGAQTALRQFEPAAMDDALARSRDLLAVPAAEVKALVQQDPLGLLAFLRERLAGEGATLNIDPRQEGYTTRDGRSRLVIAKPIKAPFDTDFDRHVLAQLDAIQASALKELPEDDDGQPVPQPRIEVAGAYRNAVEAESLIRNEGIANSIGSLVLIMIVLLLVFRSHWLVWCSAVPIVLAALVTLGVNAAFFPVSSAASGGAAMLFGLSIDAVAVLYVRYLEERKAGHAPPEAIENTGPSAVSAIIAIVTTAATYLALIGIDFPSLQELGRLVGLGILLCGLFTLLLVPALLPRRDPRVPTWVIESRWLPAFVARHRQPILAATVVVTVVLLVPAAKTRVVAALERLEPDTPAIALEHAIAERFAIPRDTVLAVATGSDLERLLEQHASFERRARDEVKGVSITSPSSLLPPARAQAAVDAVLARADDVQTIAARFASATTRAGFKPGVFDGFSERLPRMLMPGQRITLDGLHSHGLGDLVGRFVARSDGMYSTVSYVYPRESSQIAQLRTIAAGMPGLTLTGVPLVNGELEAAFLPQFIGATLAGTLAVALLLYAGFRNMRDALLAVGVTITGLTWGLGVLALAGVDIDLFSVFGLLMCFGIGIDYATHILHRRQSANDVSDALRHVAPPVIMACVTTLIGFATLIPSSYPPLASLGIVTSVTILCCAIVSLFSLPAILMRGARP